MLRRAEYAAGNAVDPAFAVPQGHHHEYDLFSEWLNGIDVGDDRPPGLEHLIDIGDVREIREIVDVRWIGQQFIAVFVKEEDAFREQGVFVDGFEHPFLGPPVMVFQVELAREGDVFEPVEVVVEKNFDIVRDDPGKGEPALQRSFYAFMDREVADNPQRGRNNDDVKEYGYDQLLLH